MNSTKNSNVNEEVEKLLLALKARDLAKYHIVKTLLDDVYNDPSLGTYGVSKDIENKFFKMVDDHVRFANPNIDNSDN